MLILRLFLAGALLTTLAACPRAAMNFPGDSCDAYASKRMVRVNYQSTQKWKAKETPPVVMPDFVKVHDAAEIPTGESRRRYCKATLVLADNTSKPVFYSWSRNFKPNLVSGPHFAWCAGSAKDECARAVPPEYSGQ